VDLFFRDHYNDLHTEEMETKMDLKQRAAATLRDMTLFVRKEMGLPKFSLKTRLSLSPHRTRSWGGARRVWMQEPVGYVSIQLRRYDPMRLGTSTATYKEYDRINHHKTIGAFVGDAYLCTTAVLAHEVAHAVEHYCNMLARPINEFNHPLAGNFHPGSEFKGHGKTWQYIYHILREKFVNPYVSANVSETINRPIPTIPAFVRQPRVVVARSGVSNIDRVCAMMRANRNKDEYWLLAEIMRILPTITRSNAKIYLSKGRERTKLI
jgi:hypothetical protein